MLEFFSILWRPPVVQVALRIVFAALIVETVGEFMSDDQADAAEVYGVVHGLIEKRRLQNSRRENDLVE